VCVCVCVCVCVRGVHQVAGAREAAMMGVPAISVSLCDYRAATVAAYTCDTHLP
jgi:broad specificity polyphosphatase/5'/3'-nucleotidase SurE